MALIKRKQLDLTIKSATAAGVSGGVYGTTNLSALAGGVYAIATGDQYEVVVDKIVGALDAVVAGSASAFYAYTANGAGSVSINLGGTVDFSGTTNQISVSKTNTGSTAVNYTFALPSAVTMPGSLSVTTTLGVTGATTLTGNVTLAGNSQTVTHSGTGNLTITSTNGDVLIEGIGHSGNNLTVPGNATFSATNANITHSGTGELSIVSTTGTVKVEGTSFNGNDVSIAGTAAVTGLLDVNAAANISGNLTLDGSGAQTITHTAATGNLTITSTNGSVVVEGTTFTGNNVTIAGNLSVVGAITQTAVNDVIVSDRFIKLADGNNGTVTLTGVYQQLNTNSFAGSVYSTSESMFRFFTTTTEPTTGTTPSSLTPATIDFGGFGANGLEALQDAVASFITAGSGIVKTYNDSSNILTISTDNAAISSNINMEVKLAADGVVDTLTVNMGNGSLNLTESDTAFFRKDQSTTGIQLSVRGTIHEDITYSATPTVGKFTVNGTGDAAVILTNTVAPSDFYDNIQNNKEYVQVFVNGIKLRWNEYSFTAGSANLNIYSGNGTVPGGMSGIGYNLDAADTITVLYYGDQNNDTV